MNLDPYLALYQKMELTQREQKEKVNCILTYLLTFWQYRLWSFQMGGSKLERFLPKNQHTQRKLLNFENRVNGEVSKIAKI